jgi:hypothetical protein
VVGHFPPDNQRVIIPNNNNLTLQNYEKKTKDFVLREIILHETNDEGYETNDFFNVCDVLSGFCGCIFPKQRKSEPESRKGNDQ